MIDTNSFQEELDRAIINQEMVAEVEKMYQKSLTEETKKIISMSIVPHFSDEWRTLSLEEIVHPEKQLKYDFKQIDQLPVIDALDNNYIVYDFNDSCWKIKNLTDNIDFDKSERIVDLLK